MTILINKASVDAGKVRVTTLAPTGNYLQGLRYCSDDRAYVDANAPTPTGQWTQGLRYASSGALFVHNVDILGVPTIYNHDGGLAITLEGALIVTTTQPVAQYNAGWPLSQAGWVCMVDAA